jgi:hypothetical protein
VTEQVAYLCGRRTRREPDRSRRVAQVVNAHPWEAEPPAGASQSQVWRVAPKDGPHVAAAADAQRLKSSVVQRDDALLRVLGRPCLSLATRTSARRSSGRRGDHE